MDFESQSHVFFHKSILMNDFDLLGIILLNTFTVVNHLHKWVLSFYPIAILWVWEERPHVFNKALKLVWLNQVYIRVVRFHHWARYFPFFLIKHQFSNVVRIISFNFFFIFFFIKDFFLILYFLFLNQIFHLSWFFLHSAWNVLRDLLFQHPVFWFSIFFLFWLWWFFLVWS